MEYKSSSPEETFAFGKKIAECLPEGAVLCLKGDLGAGKTLLVQGIAAGNHVADDVTSPTFALMNVYEGDRTLYHFDLYRLDYAEQLYDIGFYEYMERQSGIALIEWPDRFVEELPAELIWLELERTESENERRIFIRIQGKKYEKFFKELNRTCQF